MDEKEIVEIKKDFENHGVAEVLASYMVNPYAEELVTTYIQSLENLLIFMCQTYEEQEKVLFDLAKDGNDALHKVPRIQGTANTVSIAQIASVDFENPKMSFREVKDQLTQKRN